MPRGDFCGHIHYSTVAFCPSVATWHI